MRARRSRGGPVRGGLTLALPLALGLLLIPGARPAAAEPAEVPQISPENPSVPWLGELRLGMLALQRSGGGAPETRLSPGLRGSRSLYQGELLRLEASAGWQLGLSSEGTGSVSVRAWHSLLDLRLEGGLALGELNLYLTAGPLLDLAWVSLEVLGREDSGLAWHPGLVYGLGLTSEPWGLTGPVQVRLRLELCGLRRGPHDDLLATFGTGVRF